MAGPLCCPATRSAVLYVESGESRCASFALEMASLLPEIWSEADRSQFQAPAAAVAAGASLGETLALEKRRVSARVAFGPYLSYGRHPIA